MGLFSRSSKKVFPRGFYKVLGVSGTGDDGTGKPDLEFLSELDPPAGLEKFRKMVRNDPIIGGLILRLKNVLYKVDWKIEGPNAGFVKAQLDNLDCGFENILELLSSATEYGFALGELIWTVTDGRITLVDVEPRFQTSIEAINNSDGLVLQDGGTFAGPSGYIEIPYKKCVHQVFVDENRSPYGVSLLRHLYKPYYYKIAVEAAEAVGVDRDLSGLPVLTAPEMFDFSAADNTNPNYDAGVAATLDWAIDLVGNIRKDSQQGVVIPSGWDLKLIRSEGNSTIDTASIVHRYNSEMAGGLLESFMLAGSGESTGRANSDILLKDFLMSCGTYTRKMEHVINRQIIRRICDYNGKAQSPSIKLESTSMVDLAALASFVARLVAQGIITPTIPLEQALLTIADLPFDDSEENKKVIDTGVKSKIIGGTNGFPT